MSETEEKIEQLEKKVDNLQKQTIWTFGGSAVLLAVFNISLLNQSPKIARILDELFDGEPLPGITEVFIGSSSIIIISTLVIPLITIILCCRVRSYTFAVLGTLIFSLFVEMVFIISALVLPMINIVNSMG